MTRADLYKGLTRAQLLAVVVNEEIENGWFDFLSNVRYEDNGQPEEEAASKHQSHAAAKVWQAAAADAKQQKPAKQEAASEKPQQPKPTPSRPERTRKTKKVLEKVPQQVSNVWDTRSNEVSGPRKPAFDPLRAAKLQAEADQFRRDHVEKLRSADVEAQYQAALKLADVLAFGDSDNRAIAAAGAIPGIPALVEMLSSSNWKVQAAAALALQRLASGVKRRQPGSHRRGRCDPSSGGAAAQH